MALSKADITIVSMDWKNKEEQIFNIKYTIKGVEDNIDISMDKETHYVTVLSDGLITGLPKEASKEIMLMILDKALEMNQDSNTRVLWH